MSEKLTILIVDNDPIYQLVTKKLLSKSENDLIIDSFLNGEEAFLRITENDIEYKKIILLDLDMPIMDGWDFLDAYYDKMLHEKFKDCIYIVASSIALEDKTKVKEYPTVKGFIEKPLNHEILENMIKNCLNK